MDITKRTLIATLIINIVLIIISTVCIFVTHFNPVVLWLSLVMIVLVLISSVIVWRYGKEFKK